MGLFSGSTTKSKSSWDSTATNDALDRYKPDYDDSHKKLKDTLNEREKQGIYQGDRTIDDFNDQTNKAIKGQQETADTNKHTLTDLSDMRDGNVSPYFQQNMNNQLRMQRNKLLNDNAVSGMGTSDNAAILQRELGNTEANALNEQWNQTQNRRIQANQTEQQAAQNQSNILKNSMDASGKKDALEQMKLDAARGKFEEGRDWKSKNLAEYIAGLKQLDAGFGSGTNKGTSTSKNTSSGGEGWGILNAAGQAAGMIFSDERLKKFVKDTAEKIYTPNGSINIKTFAYKDDPNNTKFKGVMAQDTEKVIPEAVDNTGKYKKVNYDILKLFPTR